MPFNEVITRENGKDFKAYVARPEGGGQAPGLILMHEVYGVTDSIKKLADEFAGRGFLVVCPNMYWEQNEDASFTFETPADMEQIKAGTLPAARKALLDSDRDAARDLMFNFVNRSKQGFCDIALKTEKVVGYIEKCAGWLRAQPESNGKVATSGFCFGGRNTYLALAKHSSVDAGVAFYPTPQLSEVFKSEDAAGIDKPLLFVVGGEDPYINEKPLMVGASGTSVAYLCGLDEPFVKSNPAGNPNIGTLYYTNSTHGFNRSNSKYSDELTAQHARGIVDQFLKAALGAKPEFRLPEAAFTTTPQSETYHPAHKV
jgi:carboxymethylenebutenolidase